MTSQQQADILLQEFWRERDRRRMKELVSDFFATSEREYLETLDLVSKEMGR